MLTVLASVAYASNITIGTASLRGHRIHRRWHGSVFIVTLTLTVASLVVSFPEQWLRSIALAIATLPLATLPIFRKDVLRSPRRHIILASSAAPCYIVALTLSFLP